VLTIVRGTLLLAGVLFGAPPRGTDAERCLAEIERVRGVWTPAGGYVPIYRNLDLIAHLAAIGNGTGLRGAHPIAVLPVYSSSPVVFGDRTHLFISVSYFLSLSEEEAGKVMAAELSRPSGRRAKRSGVSCLPCGLLVPADGADSQSIRSRVAGELARY